MLATLADDVPTGSGWLYEVKWDGYRAIAYVTGGEVDPEEPPRERPDRALRRRRAGARRAPSGRPTACSTARSVRSTSRAGRASASCSRASGPLVYYVFDVLEVDGEPVARPAAARAAEAAGAAPRPARGRRSGSPRPSTTARRSTRRRRQQGLEGIVAKQADVPLPAGQAHARLAEGEDPTSEQEFIIAGYTQGQGSPRRRARLARPRRPRAAASSSGSATSAPASRGRDRAAARACSDRSSARRRRSRRSRRCPGCGEATWSGSSRSWSPRSSSRSGRTTGACGRPVVQGPARGQGAERGASRGAARRRDPPGQARARAVQPRQALLARGGHHEGRPHRLLPRRRAASSSRTCGTARSR